MKSPFLATRKSKFWDDFAILRAVDRKAFESYARQAGERAAGGSLSNTAASEIALAAGIPFDQATSASAVALSILEGADKFNTTVGDIIRDAVEIGRLPANEQRDLIDRIEIVRKHLLNAYKEVTGESEAVEAVFPTLTNVNITPNAAVRVVNDHEFDPAKPDTYHPRLGTPIPHLVVEITIFDKEGERTIRFALTRTHLELLQAQLGAARKELDALVRLLAGGTQ